MENVTYGVDQQNSLRLLSRVEMERFTNRFYCAVDSGAFLDTLITLGI